MADSYGVTAMPGISGTIGDSVVVRRRVLQASTPAAVTVLAGCVSGIFSEPELAGRLFVENRSAFTRRIALSVTDVTQGANELIHTWYRIPEWHALQFEDLLEPGRSYDIRAFQPDIPERNQARLVLNIETCESGESAGQMDVSILASASGPDLITYDCDEPYQYAQSLTYVDPSEYEAEAITRTIPSPTAS